MNDRTCWFVTYSTSMTLSDFSNRMIGPTNIVIQGRHPVEWAANPPEIYSETKSITYLHFFAEIPEEIARLDSVGSWCGGELLLEEEANGTTVQECESSED